jgi:Na+/proline symporter
MSGGQQQHQEQSFNGRYAALILEEAEKLYNQLITEFTNMAIVAAAAMTASSLSSPSISNKQKIIHKSIIHTMNHKNSYNHNQPETYNNDQEQPNKQQNT